MGNSLNQIQWKGITVENCNRFILEKLHLQGLGSNRQKARRLWLAFHAERTAGSSDLETQPKNSQE